MSATRESTIKRKAVRLALRLGVRSIKLAAPRGGETGWPDRCFLLPQGRAYFIEFKAPGGELSAKQLYHLKELNELGYPTAVCDNVEDVVKHLEAALAWRPRYS